MIQTCITISFHKTMNICTPLRHTEVNSPWAACKSLCCREFQYPSNKQAKWTNSNDDTDIGRSEMVTHHTLMHPVFMIGDAAVWWWPGGVVLRCCVVLLWLLPPRRRLDGAADATPASNTTSPLRHCELNPSSLPLCILYSYKFVGQKFVCAWPDCCMSKVITKWYYC
jgi:hypothetical protein